jgi:uncharacterized protein (DUF885 family)
MKHFSRKIAAMLILVMMVCSLSACGGTAKEKGKTREANKTSVSPVATPTNEPTKEPVDTPSVTPTATPTPEEEGLPWSKPRFTTPELTDKQKEFNSILDQIVTELADGEGMSLHFIFEHPERYGVNKENDFGIVESDPAEYVEQCKKFREMLSGVNRDDLTKGQQVNYDRLMYEIQLGLQGDSVNSHLYCGLFSNHGNIIDNLSTTITEYAFIEKQDVEDFLETMDTLPAFLKEVLAVAESRYGSEGCYLSKHMVENTIKNIQGITAKTDNPLEAAFAANLKELGLPAEEEAEYIRRYSEKLNTVVFPTLNDMAAKLNSFYAYCSEKPFGLSSVKGGKEYFEYFMQAGLGTDMTADEAFEYLKKKFDAEYEELVALFWKNPSILMNPVYEGYKETDANKMLDSLKEYIKKDYPIIRDTEYKVSDLPEALRVPGVLAYFLTPQVDNEDRKVIRFNPDNVDDPVEFFSTLAHEGYPGHLYQDEFFSRCEGHHAINKLLSYTGYMEGWAVVAGQNAYNYIIDDPDFAFVYAVNYNLSMDLAALASFGVHYKGWTAEDLAEFYKPYGYQEYAETFIDEIIADPFVFFPYTIGRYLMLDTLEALENKGYTPVEAKTAVLNIGPASFEVMWKNLGLDL